MKNFLLVDDDAVSNFLMTKTLIRIGVAREIYLALNGKEAIDLLNDYYNAARAIPDIILLDLNMPAMNGFDFIEAFHNLEFLGKKNVKIVIVSSSQDPLDVEKAKRMGVTHFISKPVSGEKLQEIVK